VATLKTFAQHVLPGEIASVDQLKPGDGGLMTEGLHKLAVCRDLDGKLHQLSAACTHLGCHVNWNATEQCWDCPCHGSQFAADGTVLNGPAPSPLVEAKVRERRRA
jgi:Rieske Fe-S protein